MAVQAPVPRFFPGDLVNYKGQGKYVILSVNSDMGFNMYKLMEKTTGEEITSSVINLERILEVVQESNEEEGVHSEPEQEKNEKEGNPRFKTLTEKELDDLQKKKTEPSTDKQMKWAVKIFKGRLPRNYFCKETKNDF